MSATHKLVRPARPRKRRLTRSGALTRCPRLAPGGDREAAPPAHAAQAGHDASAGPPACALMRFALIHQLRPHPAASRRWLSLIRRGCARMRSRHHRIGHRARRLGARSQPGVVAAGGTCPQHPAHASAQGRSAWFAVHELEDGRGGPHRLWLANQAVAFARMSRSVCSRRFLAP